MSWRKDVQRGAVGAERISPSTLAHSAISGENDLRIILEELLSALPQERLEAIARRIGWWKVSPSASET